MISSRNKIENLLGAIRSSLDSGNYFDSTHAVIRKLERKITIEEVLYVLRNGYHEARKDKYEEQFGAWNYAIRGRTLEQRGLRVIVSFDDSGMLIITAMEVGENLVYGN